MPAEHVQDTTKPITARKVFVINNGSQEYVESFKGTTYRIPPNGVKEILMPFLEARKFLARPNGLYQADNQGNVLDMGKPLATIELSDEERMEHDPTMLPADMRKKVEHADKEIAEKQSEFGKKLGASLTKEK